jgi:hypothetical protein
MLAGRHNGKYRCIFAVHNEYQKGERPFASLSDAGAGNKLMGGMVSLWNRVDDLEDG